MATSEATAQRTVNATRHAYTHEILKSGHSGKPVKSRMHAVALGLSVLVPLLDTRDAWRSQLGRIDRWQRLSVPLCPGAQL
jgi:uncharacterized protein DUF6496